MTGRKRATLWTLVLLIAIELFVVSERPKFLRFGASTELMKGYGTMRNNDLKGALTETLRSLGNGMTLQLRRSKVSGAGHK